MLSRFKHLLPWLLALVLILITIYAGYHMENMADPEVIYQVSVIIPNSGSSRWDAFKSGMNAAADDMNMNIDVLTTSNFTAIDEELRIAENEIEGGTDALIMDLCSSLNTSDLVSELSSVLPLMLVDNMPNDFSASKTSGIVAADNAAIGKAVYELAAEMVNQENERIGILGGNQQTRISSERIASLQNELENNNISSRWTLYGVDMNEATIALMIEDAPVDVLIALDNSGLEAAAQYKMNSPNTTVQIFGIGSSDQCIYYLDEGIIDGMIVPEEFYMGYQAVAQISAYLRSGTDLKEEFIGFRTVTRDNMFEGENQQILFPIN